MLKSINLASIFKNLTAVMLSFYLAIFSPATLVLASSPMPVSIPISVPVTIPAATVAVSPTNVSRDGTITVSWSGIPNPNSKDIIQFVTNGLTQIVGNGVWINNCTVAGTAPTGTPKASGSCAIDLTKVGIPSSVTTLNVVLYSGLTPGQIVAVSNQFTLSSAPAPKPDLVVEKVNVLGKHQVGAKDEIEITVKNQGNQDVNIKVGTAVYIYDPKGKKVEDFLANMEEIKAGRANTRKFILSNNYQTGGQYKVVVTADPFNYTQESNETNNGHTTNVNVTQPATINAITPNYGLIGSIATISGTGFGKVFNGSSFGKVVFYNQQNQPQASVVLLSWNDGAVNIKVPPVAKGIYSVELQTSDGVKSNRVSFTVTAAQPRINYISPAKLRVGNYMIMWGDNFGSSGKVNFYKPGSQAASGSAINYYWSNNLIFAQIPKSLPGNAEYGIQVRTLVGTDLLDSPLTYRYITLY